MARPARCPRCGRENDPTLSHCLDCGQALRSSPSAPGERVCPGCGARLGPGFRFCGRCGRLAEASPAPPSAEPPAPIPAERGTARQGPPLPAPAAPAGPEAPRGPRLAVIRHDGLPGAVHPLSREVTVCGRTGGEVVLADDPTVSPRHAAFTVRDGRVRLEDLGSAGGTFVRLRAPQILAPGAEIRVGRQLLRLEPPPRQATAGEAIPWGSPDPGYRLRLAQLLEGGGVGEVFPLRAGQNALGREVGDVTFPADRYVSGRHACIDLVGEVATLSDLGSSNGTFVKIVGAVELAAGEQVLIGMQLLRLDT